MIPGVLASYIRSTLPVAGFAWPTIADENATFNDEGTTATGWTTSNATLVSSNGWNRYTKSGAGSSSSTSPAVTFTPTNRDFIIYGKVRAKHNSGDIGVIWLLNGSKEIAIWLGTSTADTSVGTATAGTISIVGTTGASTRNVAVAVTGHNYETTPFEFALQFDSKFTSLTCWQRMADGTWDWKCRVPCDWFSASNFQVLATSSSATGMWVEFDYLTLAKPNVVVIGDSIAEGKVGFSPNRSLSLTDDNSTWMRYACLYPLMRNNLVVNKGVGSQTSAQIQARIADATGEGPRVVILHASTNDVVGGVSLSDRSINIQASITSIVAASAAAVVFNASYGTSGGADNTPSPALRDYMKDWWDNYRPAISGAAGFVDIMQPVLSGGFLATAHAADSVHPAASGYMLIGNYAQPNPLVDAYWDNVTLLMHFIGANASTGFIDQKGHAVTAVGNAQIATGGAQIGSGGVGLFDGTGDYLTVANSADYGFGTSTDYTIELFAIRAAAGVEHTLLDTRISGDGIPRSLKYYVGSTNQIAAYDSSTVYGGVGDTIPITDIVHLAWTRKNVAGTNTSRFFVNGVLQFSTSAAMDLRASRALVIGADFAFGSAFNGRMKDLRITKGVARYIDNFMPPRIQLPDTGSLPALKHFWLRPTGANGVTTFTDSSADAAAITRTGTPVVSNAVLYNGDNSIRFAGSGGLHVASTPGLDWGTGNYILRFKFRVDSTVPQNQLIDLTDGTHTTHPVVYTLGGTVRYYSGGADRITSAAIAANVDYDVELSRVADVVTMKVNGIVAGTYSPGPQSYMGGSMHIGSNYMDLSPMTGYIGQVIVHKI